MAISLTPETERLVQEEIHNGHFRSIDELILEGIYAWHEKHTAPEKSLEQRQQAVEQALEFARIRAIPLGGVH